MSIPIPDLSLPSISTAPPTREELLQVLQCIDLTTLAGDDTTRRVSALCERALTPISGSHVAALCVYPVFIDLAKQRLAGSGIRVATVAAAFPHGLSPMATRIAEVIACRDLGADEIDIVIRRSFVLDEDWESLSEEIAAFKSASEPADLKVILATGELGVPENVYRASMIALRAGADFIKTSTGKEAINATPQAAVVMLQAIRAFRDQVGKVAGFKAAGGIKTADQAVVYLRLAVDLLGEEYVTPQTFRLGASSLLDDVAQRLSEF